jgi:hypothetical protein
VFGVVFELLDEGLVLAAFDLGDVAVRVIGVVAVAPEGQTVTGGVGVERLVVLW